MHGGRPLNKTNERYLEEKEQEKAVREEEELFILPMNQVSHARSRTRYLTQNIESYAYVIESIEI